MKNIIILACVFVFTSCYNISISKYKEYNPDNMNTEVYYIGALYRNGTLLTTFRDNNKEYVKRTLEDFKDTCIRMDNYEEHIFKIDEQTYQSANPFYTNIPYCYEGWTNYTEREILARAKIIRCILYACDYLYATNEEGLILKSSDSACYHRGHKETISFEDLRQVSRGNTNSDSTIVAKTMLKQYGME